MNARRRRGRGCGVGTGKAVDSAQPGGGRAAVSSSVAQVYIRSSAADSARLIVTHRGGLRAAIDLCTFWAGLRSRAGPEEGEGRSDGSRHQSGKSLFAHGSGGRLEPCFVYPHGAAPDRAVHDVRDEHGGVHGRAGQARRHPASRHLHSLEGAGEGEQGVLRPVPAVETREGKR